uniref:hypothetical protein n=1 Tax=Klebsiella pneumoniae TaxID=573 RepID=UPI000EFBCE01
SFRGIMFNDVLDVNGPQVFAAPGAAKTCGPLTSSTSLNIMPRKEDLNQIIKSIQLAEILF